MDKSQILSLSKRWILVTSIVLLLTAITFLLVPQNRAMLAENSRELKVRVLSWFSKKLEISLEDKWYAAYMNVKEADKLETAGKRSEAAKAYRKALEGMERVGRDHPSFHPYIIRERVRLLRKQIAEIEKTDELEIEVSSSENVNN